MPKKEEGNHDLSEVSSVSNFGFIPPKIKIGELDGKSDGSMLEPLAINP